MFIKTAIALAMIAGTATAGLSAPRRNIDNPPVHVYDGRHDIDQRSNYPDDWSFWHRYDGGMHD